MRLATRIRTWMFHRIVSKEGVAAALLCQEHWGEYVAAMRRVPYGDPMQDLHDKLPWHLSNFADAILVLMLERHPVAAFNKQILWVAIISGVQQSHTVDPSRLKAAVTELQAIAESGPL